MKDHVFYIGGKEIISLPDGRQVQGVSRVLAAQDRNYEAVIYQQGRPILDSELNLSQIISVAALRDFAKLLTISGSVGPLTPLDNPDATKATFLACDVLIDGMFYRLDDGSGSFTVNVGPKPNVARNDTIYVQFYREEIAPPGANTAAREQVKKYGNLNGANADPEGTDIRDPALPTSFETTRRVQRSYRITAMAGSGPAATILSGVPAHDVDGVSQSSVTYGTPEANDPAVFRAGPGTVAGAQTLGTVDGQVIAVALATVARSPSATGTNASAITVLLPGAKLTQPMAAQIALQSNTLLENHLSDTSNAHAAGAIGVTPQTGLFTGSDVQAVLQEIATTAVNAGGGTKTFDSLRINTSDTLGYIRFVGPADLTGMVALKAHQGTNLEVELARFPAKNVTHNTSNPYATGRNIEFDWPLLERGAPVFRSLVPTVTLPGGAIPTSSATKDSWPFGAYSVNIASGIATGYPADKGHLSTQKGAGHTTQVFQSWPTTDAGPSRMWIRAARDTDNGNKGFGPWQEVGASNFETRWSVSGNQSGALISAGSSLYVGGFSFTLPTNHKLVLKRFRLHSHSGNLSHRILDHQLSNVWDGPAANGSIAYEGAPNVTLRTNLGTASFTSACQIELRNTTAQSQGAADGWWYELAVEPV